MTAVILVANYALLITVKPVLTAVPNLTVHLAAVLLLLCVSVVAVHYHLFAVLKKKV